MISPTREDIGRRVIYVGAGGEKRSHRLLSFAGSFATISERPLQVPLSELHWDAEDWPPRKTR